MYDLKIVGGPSSMARAAERYRADVGIKDGQIVEVRRRGADDPSLGGDAAETIDAAGRIVAPGFVDIHTHYDGQVSWDALLEPSSLHGVTTRGHRELRRRLRPGAAGSRGLADRADGGCRGHSRRGAHRGHHLGLGELPRVPRRDREAANWPSTWAVRWPTARCARYAMGDRGARNEPATPEDIAAMAGIVQEAVEAGALGFSTSRTLGHRAMDGEPVPGTFAAEDELFGLGRAMARGGQAVFELAPQGVAGEDIVAPKQRTGVDAAPGGRDRPAGLVRHDPGRRRPAPLARADGHLGGRIRGGHRLYPQIAARPFGMLFGFPGHHAFTHRPTYRRLKAELAAARSWRSELADPAVKAAILAEADLPVDPTKQFDAMYDLVQYCARPDLRTR